MEQRWLLFLGFNRHYGQHFLKGGQLFPFPAAAQDAVMPYPCKALGQDMKCKSAYEVVRGEFQQFLLASLFIVLHLEGYGFVHLVHLLDPGIAYCDLMVVPAQVCYHIFWGMELLLCIHYPVFGKEIIVDFRRYRHLFLAQECDVFGTEHATHRFHVEEVLPLVLARFPFARPVHYGLST